MRICPGRHLAIITLLQLVFAASAYAQANNATRKRVVYYFQTMFGEDNEIISLLPLISNENIDQHGKPFTTDVLVGAFHLGMETDHTEMHLNDLPPNNSTYDTLWSQVGLLQTKGININMFLGGAEDQSFVRLAANFSYYYPFLKQTLQTYKFDGIDLDVEDGAETTEQIKKLIDQLRSDFGKAFVITLAPVASDMKAGGGGLSNIDYAQLFKEVGSNISWFNVQFYSDFGSLATPSDYIAIINNGFPANVVVGGMLSNPANGDGFVDIAIVEDTVKALVDTEPEFGGVATWEYFNALPGGTSDPAQWGTDFGKVMGV